MTPSPLSVLSAIHRRGPLPLGDLADRERVSKSTITRIVARLQADGYVERRADPEDGRSSLVMATPRGERFLETTTNRTDVYLNQQFADLSGEDQVAIAAAMRALRTTPRVPGLNHVRAAFRSLSNRNFRLYFAGDSISSTGTWMQKIGQAWLVLELGGSGTLLGVAAALQHLPTLLVGLWGGLIADRIPKRPLLIVTQCVSGLLALALGVLTATGFVELWMVLMLALLLGVTDAFDRPARKALAMDMVGPDHLTNAITLTSVVGNAARIVGPAIAGVLIASVGLAASFFVNAASYVAVVISLLLMRARELLPAEPTMRERGQIRAGLRHVRQTPELLAPLVLMAVAGIVAYQWLVTLPLLARDAFGGDAQTLGLLFSATGAGAVVGGLAVASFLQATPRALVTSALLFSGLLLLVALAPNLTFALVVLVLLGGASITFKALAQSIVQLRSDPQMRGRVTALLAVATAGTIPLGGPLLGWIGGRFGARTPIGLGAIVTAVATVVMIRYLRRTLWSGDLAARVPGTVPVPSGVVPSPAAAAYTELPVTTDGDRAAGTGRPGGPSPRARQPRRPRRGFARRGR
jgi:DNA-binding MarR family transcriptional regulator/MFS family permease